MLSFRPKNVAIILGLQYDRDIVVFMKKKTQSPFEEKYQSKIYERKMDAIKKLLSRLFGTKEKKINL